jgi:hypothetical protein
MATQSAKNNVIDTLVDHLDSLDYGEDEIAAIAEAIVQNLGIKHQIFPKWE